MHPSDPLAHRSTGSVTSALRVLSSVPYNCGVGKFHMTDFRNPRDDRHPMRLWHGGLIVFAICALTVNIATRYSAWGSESASARTVTTVKTQSLDCQRQRLLSDGLYWISPVTRSTFLRPPRSTARAISAVSPAIHLDSESWLYNRPPPSCWS